MGWAGVGWQGSGSGWGVMWCGDERLGEAGCEVGGAWKVECRAGSDWNLERWGVYK